MLIAQYSLGSGDALNLATSASLSTAQSGMAVGKTAAWKSRVGE
jgi:hypothetical protein